MNQWNRDDNNELSGSAASSFFLAWGDYARDGVQARLIKNGPRETSVLAGDDPPASDIYRFSPSRRCCQHRRCADQHFNPNDRPCPLSLRVSRVEADKKPFSDMMLRINVTVKDMMCGPARGKATRREIVA